MSEVDILIGGDVVPLGRNLPYFEAGETSALLNDLQPEFEKSDISIVNLECPLIEKPDPISKTGLALGASSHCIAALRFVDVLNLANNHILDHGKGGLENTISVCRGENIECVGAGKNLAVARQVLIQQVKGVRVGIMGTAEHEFSIATKDSYGASPLDIMDYIQNVREHKDQWDYLIVLFHGGNEYYPFPSPRLQRVCRFMIEEGADAVICQHSHCPGSYETYQNKHIVYGQGNLLFDRIPCANDEWNKGFLVRLVIKSEHRSVMSFIPYIQSDLVAGAKKMNADQALVFLQELKERSDKMQEEDFLESKWNEFCEDKKREYLRLLFFPQSRIFNYLDRKFKLVEKFISKEKRELALNLIRCESHRDIVENIL